MKSVYSSMLGLFAVAFLFSAASCEKESGRTPGPATPVGGVSHTEATPAPPAAHGAQGSHAEHKPSAAPSTASKPATAQQLCPVMEGPIDADVYLDHQGRRVYFCCDPCKDKFKADPAKYLAKLDKQLAAATKPAR